MLQAIQAVHQVSVVHPTPYFGSLALLALVLCFGWYRLGVLNQAAIMFLAPAMTPVRPRCVFLRQSHTLLLLIANLAIVGKLEANGDMIVATVAVKVT